MRKITKERGTFSLKTEAVHLEKAIRGCISTLKLIQEEQRIREQQILREE